MINGSLTGSAGLMLWLKPFSNSMRWFRLGAYAPLQVKKKSILIHALSFEYGLRNLLYLRHLEIAHYIDLSNFPVAHFYSWRLQDVMTSNVRQDLYDVSSLETLLIGNCPEIENFQKVFPWESRRSISNSGPNKATVLRWAGLQQNSSYHVITIA